MIRLLKKWWNRPTFLEEFKAKLHAEGRAHEVIVPPPPSLDTLKHLQQTLRAPATWDNTIPIHSHKLHSTMIAEGNLTAVIQPEKPAMNVEQQLDGLSSDLEAIDAAALSMLPDAVKDAPIATGIVSINAATVARIVEGTHKQMSALEAVMKRATALQLELTTVLESFEAAHARLTRPTINPEPTAREILEQSERNARATHKRRSMPPQ